MIRIATVGYLNAAPLVAGLDHSVYQVNSDIPSRVAQALREGTADVALTPVVGALNDGDFRIVGGVAIGSEGPVHSVLLVAESEPEHWQEIVLDGESRTSAVLTQVLLQGPLAARCDVTVRSVEPGAGVELARGNTAALVIGDAAMHLPERLTTRLDLGEIWKDWTGLPFVFAVWAGRPDLPASVREDLRASAQVGLAEIDQRYSGSELEYLRSNIRYVLDDRALMGLRRFAALAHRAGLIEQADVRLYGPAETHRARGDGSALFLERAARGERLTSEELMLCAAHQPLSELAAAASLRSEAPNLPSVAFGRRLCVDGAADDVAASLTSLKNDGIEYVEVTGLAGLTPEESSRRLGVLRGVGGGLLSITVSDLDELEARWELSSADLLEWLARHGVVRITGLSLRQFNDSRFQSSSFTAVVSVAIEPSEDPTAVVQALEPYREAIAKSSRQVELELRPQTNGGTQTSAVEGLRALCLYRLALPVDVGLSMPSDVWGPSVAGSALRMGGSDLAVVMTDDENCLLDGEPSAEHRTRLGREIEANGFSGVGVPVSSRSSGRAPQA